MQIPPSPPPAPIPSGVADYFWADALLRRRYEAILLGIFRQWGYADVFPPAFEYANTFDARANPELQKELYRFVDRDGSLLALRADMTIPVARLVATRLHDAPMPQRFCYAGSIYRYADTHAGQQREFWQAGVELIGAANPASDAEVLALTVSALAAVGLDSIRLAVGHLGFFNALIGELALDDSARGALLETVDRNSDASLAAFLQQTVVPEPARAVVAALPHLSGDNPDAILDHADHLCLNDQMRAAVANLRGILSAYAMYGVSGEVGGGSLYLDLTEIHNLGYYTGLTFEALAPGLGYPVAGGGRYDRLVGTFGVDRPAVGVAMTLDRILHLHHLSRPRESRGPIAPHVLVGGAHDRKLLQIVRDMRAAHPTLRIVLDVGERIDPAEFDGYAKSIAACVALWFTGTAFLPADANADSLFAGEAWSPREAIERIGMYCAQEPGPHSPLGAGDAFQ